MNPFNSAKMEDILSIIITLIIFILTIIFCCISLRKGSKNLPPGPKGVPILGNYFNIRPTSWLAFQKIGKQYGSVCSIRIGTQPYIILTNYKAIKEAFITKADNFAGRQKNGIASIIFNNSGIITVDGSLWQEHRRFSLQTLRDFGLGHNSAEFIIQTEMEKLSRYLDARIDTSVNINDLLMRTITNVICTITLSEQPGYNDKDEFKMLMDKLRQFFNSPVFTTVPLMFPQIVQSASTLLRYLPSVNYVFEMFEAGHNYIKQKVVEHQRTIDFEGEARDFTDAYLQLKQKKDASGKPHTFTEWQLIRVIFGLFFAGTETTSNSLSWGLIWMALRPDIQSKIQKEIENTISQTSIVSFKDRKDMPYTQAVMDEIQRWASVVPNSVLHRNFQTDTLSGYTIPADSIIIPCIYSVHHDPEIWEKPDDFYPEHFLDDSKTQYRPREELIPFSIGRRACLGEALARTEYFIFFVSLIRRYSVTLSPSYRDKLDSILLGTDGPIRAPGYHELIIKFRE